ncbi:NAD(P)/FAD-dependent oxidoreductase [Lachnobacterium bovis]|uniref:FAD-dependent protein C-terminal domain-containing protein n=1 Tax=Lachnobacterium bovis TaxID=140626 RepID=A0A1H9PZL8_9FIRM|nr:FAD-dependent oxidoreductase [Lachnobacterium bovis]SER53600.1 hypothetical protein SAMN02910429_00387 [Lachnobacterium bovis]
MIRINQIKLPLEHKEDDLKKKIASMLKLKKDFSYKIVKKSIDARKKPDIFWVYAVNIEVKNESKVLSHIHNKSIMPIKEVVYKIPSKGEEPLLQRPVVVGAGPAGLFSAYLLTESGFMPIILEQGKTVEERQKDVEQFWKTGILDPFSNVQFGEGGAGTFSDGKLNTAIKDKTGRNKFVLETFVKFGANENILYDNKPHIGTDVLCNVIANMRNYMIEKGCTFKFNTRVVDFVIENSKIHGLILQDGSIIQTQSVVLALGHSARLTFETLYKHKVEMQAKSFAVGFRVEHPQRMINEIMYGPKYFDKLPASPYKVTSNFPNGRGVYSFCMCPGGYVVNSSSEENRLVVNGMSYSQRAGSNANSAIIVSVNPEDFGYEGPLAGMYYQRMLEEKNYKLGNGKIPQQLFGDYINNIESKNYGDFDSTTKGATTFANLRGLMSCDMEVSFIEGMKHFSNIVKGFDRYDAILSGMETRTSSPIRINRNTDFESNVKGLYPCGEGAGFAGGITSAAMDGLKVAEKIIEHFNPTY